MSKKKKKFRWKSLPSTCRTCIIAMIVLLVAGIGVIVYGNITGISASDVRKVEAEIVSIDLVDRDLSNSQAQNLLENGADENSVLYEYEIGYRYIIDGREYRHVGRKHYDKGSGLKVGDKETLRYAVVGGEIVIDPQTETSYGVLGVILVIAGVLAGAAAFILRPQRA